jgi:hypothetical protein
LHCDFWKTDRESRPEICIQIIVTFHGALVLIADGSISGRLFDADGALGRPDAEVDFRGPDADS